MNDVMHARRLSTVADHHLDDHTLVDAIVRHRTWALAEVYRRHSPAVYGVAARLCAASANRVTEDVFVSFWRDGARDEMFVSSIGDYLLVDAHERCLESLRADRAQHSVAGLVDANDLEARLLAPWAGDRLGAMLGDLAADERRAFCFAEFAGFSDAEIAELSGWTLASTEHHLGDARRRIDALRREGHAIRASSDAPPIGPV